MKELIIPQPANGRFGFPEWGSHIPVITKVLDRLQPKTILELGSGDHSTIVFHSYVTGVPGRSLVTLDNDLTWIEGLAWQRNAQHEIRYVPDWDPKHHDGYYDLIFIDQAPEETRWQISLEWAATHCTVAMVHDENYVDRYGHLYPLFASRVNYGAYKFHTGVFGREIDVTEWWPDGGI
jgi:hypothetical protein